VGLRIRRVRFRPFTSLTAFAVALAVPSVGFAAGAGPDVDGLQTVEAVADGLELSGERADPDELEDELTQAARSY
jgi:hypothetical protein